MNPTITDKQKEIIRGAAMLIVANSLAHDFSNPEEKARQAVHAAKALLDVFIKNELI